MEDKKRIAQEDFFDPFYEKNFKKMFAYANAIVENHDLAEEVVQDAYLEALKQLDFLVGTELPERWLQQVVKHKALHAKRTQMRDKWRLAELNEGLIPDSFAEKELREVETQRKRGRPINRRPRTRKGCTPTSSRCTPKHTAELSIRFTPTQLAAQMLLRTLLLSKTLSNRHLCLEMPTQER